jgi:hypothetical protein
MFFHTAQAAPPLLNTHAAVFAQTMIFNAKKLRAFSLQFQ